LSLGTIHGIAAFSFAYIIGSIFGISAFLVQKIRGKNMENSIAFGPFLGLGWVLSILYYTEIIEYIENIIHISQ
jgi:prepilin signal peptidase PulO-like enzyme (type II secretory pathway)